MNADLTKQSNQLKKKTKNIMTGSRLNIVKTKKSSENSLRMKNRRLFANRKRSMKKG